MFGKCIKNYFINLKYVFAVLGILFLALMIGGTILLEGTKNTISTMTEQIKTVTGDATLTAEDIANSTKARFMEEFASDSKLERGSIDEDGDRLVSGEELQNGIVESFTEAVAKEVDNFTDYVGKIGGIISTAILNILMLLMVFVGIQFIGGIASNGFVFLVETCDQRRNPIRLIIARTLKNIFVIAIGVLILWIYSKQPMVGTVMLVFVPLIYCFIALLSAALSQSKKHKAPMSKVLSVSNLLTLFTTNILMLIVYVLIGIGVLMVSNLFIAFYVEYALCVVASATALVNADTICYETAKKRIDEETESEDDITFTEIDE